IVTVASRFRPRSKSVWRSIYREQALVDHVGKRALPLPAAGPDGAVTEVSVVPRYRLVVASGRRVVLLRHHQILPSNEGVSSARTMPISRSIWLVYGGVFSQWRPQPVACT